MKICFITFMLIIAGCSFPEQTERLNCMAAGGTYVSAKYFSVNGKSAPGICIHPGNLPEGK